MSRLFICPQATQSLHLVRTVPDPLLIAIERIPMAPRQPLVGPPPPPPPPNVLIPLRTPKFDGTAAYWWGLMVSSVAATNSTILNQAAALAASPHPVHHWPQVPGSIVPAFGLAVLPDRAVLAVAGTANVQQAIAYIIAHATGDRMQDALGRWINRSWLTPALSVAAAVRPLWVAAGQPPLEVIGHSMGAPVSSIAYQLLVDGLVPFDRQFDRCVTFGAPRWLTADYKAAQPFAQRLRFVTAGDSVALQPPPDYVFLLASLLLPGVLARSGGGYLHAGVGIELAGYGLLTQTLSETSNALDWSIDTLAWLRGNRDLTGHLMQAYRAKLADWYAYMRPRTVAGDFQAFEFQEVEDALDAQGL